MILRASQPVKAKPLGEVMITVLHLQNVHKAAVKVDTKCTAAAVEHSTMTVLPYHDRMLSVH